MPGVFKSFGIGLASWFRKKLDPLVQILRRGAEPKQLAFSGALGITLGVFPICGVTVFLCGMAIAVLRSMCHAPTVMLANFIATPIEFSSGALKKVLTGQASREVMQSVLHSLLGWLVSAPFILAALYLLFLPIFIFLVGKFSTGSSFSPKKQLLSVEEVRLKMRDV